MVVEFLGNCPGMIENCRVTNAESEDRVDLLLCVGITAIRAECPGVGVQSKNIMPLAGLLFCNMQGFGRSVSMTQVVQNEFPVCIGRFVCRPECFELKILIGAGGIR